MPDLAASQPLPCILLVDDDPIIIRLLARMLGGLADIRFATSGQVALKMLRERPADLVLLDGQMPGMTGQEVCKAIQSDHALMGIPLIFVTASNDEETELAALTAGAVDFVSKPIREHVLLARVKTQLRIKALTDQLRSLAATDALTGCANRRRFDEVLPVEWARSLRGDQALSLLMIDIDHFKRFNDHYGHPAGDECLRKVARVLLESALRPFDLVARVGGEEFAILLPQTARSGAQRVATSLLSEVQQLALPHAHSPTAEHVTMSIGIGCYDADSACWSAAEYAMRHSGLFNDGAPDILQAADQALYAAKRAGRSRAWMLDVADLKMPERAREVSAVELQRATHRPP